MRRVNGWMKLSVGLSAAAAIGFAVLAFVLFLGRENYHPLGVYSVMTVDSRIPGTAGPAVKAKDEVVITTTRCTNSDKPMETTGYAYWISRDGRTPVVKVQNNPPMLFLRPPGCDTRIFRIKLPPEVTPGLWRLEAVDAARKGDLSQVVSYWSEDFRVVS